MKTKFLLLILATVCLQSFGQTNSAVPDATPGDSQTVAVSPPPATGAETNAAAPADSAVTSAGSPAASASPAETASAPVPTTTATEPVQTPATAPADVSTAAEPVANSVPSPAASPTPVDASTPPADNNSATVAPAPAANISAEAGSTVSSGATSAATVPAESVTTSVTPVGSVTAVTETLAAMTPGATVPTTNAAASTNSMADEIIPAIRFDAMTTLPEAVRTLAQQAGINFQFDPKLMAPDPTTGKPPIHPTVEIFWQNVTPMQALTALLENHGWQLIQDPKTKIARVTLKDLAALEPLVTKVLQLKYSNPTNIIAGITNTFADKRSKLIADVRTHQLIVLTTEKEIPGVEALVEKLDKATKEILIEAILTETTRTPSTLKGVDWTSTFQGQNVSFGNGTTTGTTTTSIQPGSTTTTAVTEDHHLLSAPSTGGKTVSEATSLVTAVGAGGFSANTLKGFHPATAFLNADGVHAVLSFLNSDSDTESLALPRSVAMDGVETTLSVVRNIPVFEQETSAGQGGGNNITAAKPVYDKKVNNTILNEVGVKLKVTPRIVGLTNVHLTLQPEVSAKEAVPERQLLDGKLNEAPIFNRRMILTEATVPSGFTLVLGGLNNDIVNKNFTKIPVLGDLPGLGLLFRHDSKTRTKQNLLIFVTPTIIEDSDFQRTKTDFMKNKFVPRRDDGESAWDSGKPVDWTKPGPNVEPLYAPKALK